MPHFYLMKNACLNFQQDFPRSRIISLALVMNFRKIFSWGIFVPFEFPRRISGNFGENSSPFGNSKIFGFYENFWRKYFRTVCFHWCIFNPKILNRNKNSFLNFRNLWFCGSMLRLSEIEQLSYLTKFFHDASGIICTHCALPLVLKLV